MSKTEVFLSALGVAVTAVSFGLLAMHMILWSLGVAVAGGAAILLVHGLAERRSALGRPAGAEKAAYMLI